MLLARIAGTVVATRKDPRLEGKKLLICQLVNPKGNDEKGYIIAVVTVNAGFREKAVESLEILMVGAWASMKQ